MTRSLAPQEQARQHGGWKPWITAFGLFLAWCGLLTWQGAEHFAHRHEHERSFVRTGQASLGVVEAAVRAVGRQRRQRPEFLDVIFGEVAAVPGFLGTWLTEPDGTIIFSKGVGSPPEAPQTFVGAKLRSDGLLLGRMVDIGECVFDGRGQPRTPEAIARPTYLFFLFDRSEMDEDLAQDLRLRGVVQGAAALAAMVGFLAIRARMRTRRLRTELAVAEERSRRHREWALLGAGLAHETKNPLAVVRGLAQELLQEHGEGAPVRQSIQDMLDEVDRVVGRINEFLHYSRPSEPRFERVELRPLLEAMGRLIQPDLEPKRATIEIDAIDGAVLGDGAMLRQILLNLLVNAARAIPEGGRIALRARSEGAATASLEVEDSGPGIPEAERERIFEPYHTCTPGGTGLGLSIVRRLAEAHGLQVELVSHAGRGTIFRIHGLKRWGE